MGKEIFEWEPGKVDGDVPWGTILEKDVEGVEGVVGVRGGCGLFKGVPSSLDALPRLKTQF